MSRKALTVALLIAFAAVVVASPPATRRVVFVSATDRNGRFVDDLTPADLVAKEGGTACHVLAVEPPGPATVATILIEEGLSRDTDVNMSVVRLVQKLQDRAQIALMVAGPSNAVVVPHTSDGAALIVGLNGITRSPRPAGGRLVEGIVQAAQDLQRRRAERRTLIAIAMEAPDVAATTREQAMSALRESGTTLFALALRGPNDTPQLDSMMDTSIRSWVMSEGSTQSGGRFEVVARTVAFPQASISVADEILHQVKVTYEVPDGITANGRLSITSTRPGVKVRAPTRLAER